MRRVSKAVATASLLIALTTSNVYAIPSKSKIVKFIRHIVGLDLGDMSLPHP